jgi:hypothetical protein
VNVPRFRFSGDHRVPIYGSHRIKSNRYPGWRSFEDQRYKNVMQLLGISECLG